MFMSYWLLKCPFSIQNHMMKNITVSMTGFASDPKDEQYKAMMERLGIRYAPSLAETASALIVNEVTTEKYKIAKLYKRPILCVKIDWIIESDKANTILDPSDYEIKEIFYRVQAYLIGFNDEQGQKIEETIHQNGGISHHINMQRLRYCVKNNQIRLLVVQAEFYTRVRPIVAYASFPVVGIEWLIGSLNAKMCKFPYDYALNQSDLGRNDTLHHLKKMKNKLNNALESTSCFERDELLSNSIICFPKQINQEMVNVLKKVIAIQGGFYLEQMNPVVTHVLVEPLEENQYLECCSNGMLTHILRIEWLLDTIYFHRRMAEEDYVIRSFKQTTEIMDEKSVTSVASGIITSFRRSQDSNRQSISIPKFQCVPKKVKQQLQSTIFVGCNFYIEGSQRNEPELMTLYKKIIKNGGKCYNSRQNIEAGLCYYVLKDNSSCTSLINTLKSQLKKIEVQIQPVSFRWVNHCVSKATFFDITTTESYIYKPLSCTTPIHGFFRLIFSIVTQDIILKRRLLELCEVLGSMKKQPDRSEVTHCLCGQGYADMPRYKELRKENTNAVFLDWKWLIECANTGKIAEMAPYIITE